MFWLMKLFLGIYRKWHFWTPKNENFLQEWKALQTWSMYELHTKIQNSWRPVKPLASPDNSRDIKKQPLREFAHLTICIPLLSCSFHWGHVQILWNNSHMGFQRICTSKVNYVKSKYISDKCSPPLYHQQGVSFALNTEVRLVLQFFRNSVVQ